MTDAADAADAIVAAEAKRAAADPVLVVVWRARHHWNYQGWWAKLRVEWELMPNAEKEQLILIGAAVVGTLLQAIFSRMGGNGR
jgi:hypothetical protein